VIDVYKGFVNDITILQCQINEQYKIIKDPGIMSKLSRSHSSLNIALVELRSIIKDKLYLEYLNESINSE